MLTVLVLQFNGPNVLFMWAGRKVCTNEKRQTSVKQRFHASDGWKSTRGTAYEYYCWNMCLVCVYLTRLDISHWNWGSELRNAVVESNYQNKTKKMQLVNNSQHSVEIPRQHSNILSRCYKLYDIHMSGHFGSALIFQWCHDIVAVLLCLHEIYSTFAPVFGPYNQSFIRWDY